MKQGEEVTCKQYLEIEQFFRSGEERLCEEGREVIPGREKQEEMSGNYWHVREPAVW